MQQEKEVPTNVVPVVSNMNGFNPREISVELLANGGNIVIENANNQI